MVRLVDLNPTWIDHGKRKGLGVAFDCMVGTHHGKHCVIRNWILFSNPLDGGPAWPGESRALMMEKRDSHEASLVDGREIFELAGCGKSRWLRIGDNFESLSMTPSVNAGPCGHMTLTNGIFA